MAEQQEGARLPSLVADDLVDLSRRRAMGIPGLVGGAPFSHPYRRDDGTVEDVPLQTADGLPVALPYATMELLVEIRDLLREPVPTSEDQPTTRKPLDDYDLAIISDRLRVELEPIALGGRVPAILAAVEKVLRRSLREKGVLA